MVIIAHYKPLLARVTDLPSYRVIAVSAIVPLKVVYLVCVLSGPVLGPGE